MIFISETILKSLPPNEQSMTLNTGERQLDEINVKGIVPDSEA